MTVDLGRNSKWTVKPEHRETIRRLFEQGLGVHYVSPVPAVDQFKLGAGSIGVEYDDAALSAEDARKGAWLELLVDDPEQAAAGLEAAGAERIAYHDKAHAYFQAPGGPVFRLAK
jgi:hypothetical protein